MNRRIFCNTVLAAGLLPAALAQSPHHDVSLSVEFLPTPVRVEDTWLLLYELHIRSNGREPIEPTALSIDAVPLNLTSRVAYLDGDARRHATIYIELPARDLPARVRHEVEYKIGGTAGAQRVHDEGVAVRAVPRIALGAPLLGGPWVAVHSPDWPRGHRRVFYLADGRQVLPGRFAIDWVRVDELGRIARGDENEVAHHYGYGAPVLAVADGRIVAIRDTASEPATLDARAKHSVDDASGNYVVLQLPDRRFAIYEHLQPGSLKVRAGDRVRAGQTLAALGFTGDSTGPHLHLHVSDVPTPGKGEGVAYHFQQFSLLGHYRDITQLGKARWEDRPANLTSSRQLELPASNAVVTFDST